MAYHGKKEINDLDRAEIARLIAEGYTSGIVDADGYRIAWSLEAEKFRM